MSDFSDALGKVGKAVAKGALSYLESASRSNSRSENFTDEQRESFKEYADRVHDWKENLSDN